jgi:excisionase family DNA binding protein
MNQLLTPSEVSEVLQCSLAKVYSLSSRGEIDKIRIGGLLRFQEADVAEFIRQRQITAREIDDLKY